MTTRMNGVTRTHPFGPGMVAGSVLGIVAGAAVGLLTQRWSLMGLAAMLGAGAGLLAEVRRASRG